MDNRKIIMIGSPESITPDIIDEITAHHGKVEFISPDEANDRGLTQLSETEITPLKLINLRNTIYTPPPTRAERRKQQRKK